MRTVLKLVLASMLLACSPQLHRAQDLAPRAYTISPLHSNAVTLTYSYYTGNLLFDGAVPVTGATGKIHIPVVSLYHSFSFFGRSANIIASLPYGFAHYRGTVADAEASASRSGLLDTSFRISVNIKGGPAMPPQDFRKWRQKTLLGVSLKVVAPTGQYDSTKLINWSSNRWAFRPEFGYSRRWGHWVLDAYAACWFYTTNPEFFSHNAFFPGTRTQSENPVGAFEGHLSYDFKPWLWVSLDGNFWTGGKTSLNGVQNPNTLQRNSRVGVTGSFPLFKHQSLKVSYNDGAYINYGGNYHNLSVAWQYSWLGRPN
jgi:hypothetical protein